MSAYTICHLFIYSRTACKIYACTLLPASAAACLICFPSSLSGRIIILSLLLLYLTLALICASSECFLNIMTNPAHQSHKVSGVSHIYDCFGSAGLAPANSNYANRYTSTGRYGRYRRVCTSGFYRGLRRCPQANTTRMKSREVMTSYILVFAAQEIYAACVMIWNVLPPSRPSTVFRFSADQINVFIRCTFFGSRSPSAVHRRPLVMDYAPSLSGVSQLLSVCFPADWLQRGATPAASPASVPHPPSCCSSRAGVRKQCSSFRAVRIIIALVGGVVLPPPHAALGADRLARRPPCKA